MIKIKKKILFLIGLVLLLCSNSVFALTLSNANTDAVNVSLYINQSQVNTAGNTAAIAINNPTGAEFSISQTGGAYFKFNPVSGDPGSWGTTSSGLKNDGILYIQGSATNTVAITVKINDTQYKVYTLNLAASQTFDAPSAAGYAIDGSKIANISASQAGNNISITPTVLTATPDSSSSSTATAVNYAFNASIDNSGTGESVADNIGSLSSASTSPYTGTLKLADSDDIWSFTSANNAGVCSTFEIDDNETVPQAFYTYASPLVITPVLTGLQFQFTNSGSGYTSLNGESFTYNVGSQTTAKPGDKINLIGQTSTSGNDTTAVIYSGTSSSKYPILNVELTPQFVSLSAGSLPNNDFFYGSKTTAGAEGTLTYLQYQIQQAIKFASSNSEVATLSGNGLSTLINFGQNPGVAQITASATMPYGTINSNQQDNYFNQNIIINIPDSVVDVASLSFTNKNLTVTNYSDAQEQTLNTGLTVTPDNALIPAISNTNLTFTITSTSDSTITANYRNGSYVSGTTSLSNFSFIQNPNEQGGNIYLVYDGSGAQVGNYTITANYKNNAGTALSATTNLTVGESESEPEVFVVYDGEELTNLNSGTFNQLTGKIIDLDYSVTGIENPQSVEFVEGTGWPTGKALLNPQTGQIRLLSNLTPGDSIPVKVLVNGISSEEGLILITGTAPTQSGLEPEFDPDYIAQGTASYNMAQNVIVLPEGEPISTSDANNYQYTVTPKSVLDNGVSVSGYSLTIDEDFTGNFTVTVASLDNLNVKTSYVVRVIPKTNATGISVTPQNMQLGATGLEQGQINASLIPANATTQGHFTYSSSNSNSAYVDGTGLVTAVSPGKATITIKYLASDGNTVLYSTTTTVTVVEETEQITSITASPASVTVQPESSQNVTITTVPAGLSGQVSWESSNTQIATVEVGEDGNLTINGLAEGTTTIVGTAGNTTCTINVTVSNQTAPTSFTVSPIVMHLTSLDEEGYQNTQQLEVTLIPTGTTANITYSSSAPNVANVSSTGLITAVSPGTAHITVTVGDLEPQNVTVLVSNEQVICDGVEVTSQTPDYFTVTAYNVRPNPALGGSGTVQQVSMFTWSTSNQSDMQCKVATSMANNNWTWDSFNVNDLDTFYVNADDIHINVYGSLVAGENGNMIGADNYKSVNNQNAYGYNDGYIAYCQNIAFDKPTILSGLANSTDVNDPSTYSGTVGEHLQMEGVRVSSNISGVEVNTSVHVENIGWMDEVGDGVYAGTMHRNLQIESVNFNLSGANASNYIIQYRVHQENVGWSSWVSGRTPAGITGQHLQLEAIQLRIVPYGTPMPTD